jgi:hypothetical protein
MSTVQLVGLAMTVVGGVLFKIAVDINRRNKEIA